MPLKDGLPQALDCDVKEVEDVAKQISFGPYEAIFQSSQKPVLVVTSMGAQSTGKSYQLNHLGGTLFDVSGEYHASLISHVLQQIHLAVLWKTRTSVPPKLPVSDSTWHYIENLIFHKSPLQKTH
jgi:hypothetical protein